MKHIESRDNPRFKALRALVGDAREQQLRGRTLIDGPHLVAAYRQKVGAPELLLVSESGLERDEIRQLLAEHEGVDALLLRDALFRELSGVASPAGIAAEIAIPAAAPAPQTCDCVLLDAVQDAGNVGSILRSAAAAGISHVCLGTGCAGAWTPRVLRAAQGAHFDLQLYERCDLRELLRAYRGCAVATVAGGASLFDADLAGPLAWVFGNEGQGIAAEVLDLCRLRLGIPLAAHCESLNVAAAAAVCLFEGVRRRGLRKRGGRG